MIVTLRNSAQRRMTLIVVTVIWLIAIPTTCLSFGVNDCAPMRFGSDLGCTANDVSITGISIVPGGPTKCVGGSAITLDLDVNVNFASPDRWDIGLFLSNDGKSPEKLAANGGALSCTVAVIDTPTINPATAFLNLDPGPWSGVADTCGDGNGTISGGTGSGIQRITGVPVACQAVSLSGGRLFIPFLTSWDNQKSPSGSTCTSNRDPVPNTKSKCNVPNGTVLADVLKSTVNLVVLPTISKTDGITTVTAGNSTTYTVVITNTTGAILSNAIFRDLAVANLTVNSLICSATGGATCPATSIATMQGGGITLPTMPVNSSLTFSIGATVSSAAPAGPLTNTAEVIVDAESNSATDINNVIKKLIVTKAFTPASIVANGESTLSITLQNSNLTAATSVNFTDNYPINLFNTSSPATTNSCGGTVTASAGGSSLTLSGGTIPAAGGSCTITVQVTSNVAGAYTNSTGIVNSAEGYTGDSASASLAVGVSNFSTSTKSLLDLNGGEPDPGDVIRYIITLNETAGVSATGISISDTLSSSLTNLSVNSCPLGATCGFSGQTFSATGITVPANGTVSVVIDGTIAGSTTAGTTINNCADISNPSGIGASPCASTIIVSPSAVLGSGNKLLYLYDSTAAYKLSRSKPSGAMGSVAIASSASRTWALSPTLATPLTISPNVTPLAIIPISLYLASDAANVTRTVQAAVTCSGGGTTYSETKIFDGTAVNNPYLSTSPTRIAFNKLTISADHFCGAGQSWNLTVSNTGSGSVIVHPVSGVNNSYISLPSLNVINVDSVTSYSVPYTNAPNNTTPANGYFGGGQTVFIRSIVSDPFGSFDITSATVTIINPYGTTVVSAAAMAVVTNSGSATKTFEYQYTVPASGPSGTWTTVVTAQEGTEGTISDSGTGFFKLGLASLLVVKSAKPYFDPINGIGADAKAIPGAFMDYTILVTNTGPGAVDPDTTVITDPIPANTELFVGDFDGAGPALGPILFTNGTTASGLSYTFTSLASTTDNLAFSGNNGTNYDKSNTTPDSNECDPTVTNIKIPLNGIFNGSDGTNHPSFNVKFRVRIK